MVTWAPATARAGWVKAGGEGVPSATREAVMAGVVVAVVLIGVIFVIGIAFGVLITIGVSAYRKGDGPGPRGGGRGPKSG